MKLITKIITAACLIAGTAFCIAASSGTFSAEKKVPEQNRFGGFGEIQLASHPQNNFFFDDTKFYYVAEQASSWCAFPPLVAYDLQTGTVSAVCKRISCDHTSAECPLSSLQDNSFHLLFYTMADHYFYAPQITEDQKRIVRWDPLTDEKKTVAEFPMYQKLSDSAGMSSEYETFYSEVMRLTDDLLLMNVNNICYVCDNQMQERLHFPCSYFMHPLVSGRTVYWDSEYSGVCSCNLDTGEMRYDILTELLGANKKVCLNDAAFPAVSFAYGSCLYFPYKNAIYAYHCEQESVREITKTDAPSDDAPYICLGAGNEMYFRLNGTVQRMDLDTGITTELPGLPQVPAAAVRDLLLVKNAVCNGTSADFRRYDRNGKAVGA